MSLVAVPVFRRRVAPVFDFCLRVLLIKMDHNREVARTEIYFEGHSQTERVEALTRADVNILICGGISDSFLTILENSGIRVIWGIAGPIKDVVAGFLSDRLSDPQFGMPGYRRQSFKQRHRRTAPYKQITNKSIEASTFFRGR